ncbi:MAG: nucleotidyltransferase domain-containing protein [Dehalococcoidia bacterium]|nr:nucleotidyltransferase domain-containing protein [Dehalococcoidia bacterium]
MLGMHMIDTVNQRVLGFLARFSGREFYERQIARKIGIGYGSANRALNELYSTGAIKRRQEGKMYFYSVDLSNPIVIEFKKLVNLLLIEPVVEELKNISKRVVLYGSCAQGADTSESDLDLFVVSDNKEEILEVINSFRLPRGFEELRIQPVVKSPVELLEAKGAEQAFIEEVERGIVLWEGAAGEPRV